jgi:hypothetical protein
MAHEKFITEAKRVIKKTREPKKKWEPREFPDSKEGALDAYHHLVDKSMHAKKKSDYRVSADEAPHTWIVSHPKKKFSAVVYTKTRPGEADFEEADHDKAMRRHEGRSKYDQ